MATAATKTKTKTKKASAPTNDPERLRQAGIRLVNSWRADWNKFAREVLGVYLDPEQQAILSSVQHHSRTSVASGTARGKDFVAACAALAFLYLTPKWRRNANGGMELAENTKVALTAPTDRQVKNIMMPEIKRLWERAHSRGFDLPGAITTYDIRTGNSEWFLTGFKADENNHEAWSGFHAVHTMFVITEATGISDDTFAAIEGDLQGDSRILLVFNPNTSVGYAAKSQKGDRWSKYRLNSLTAPNVTAKRIIIPGQVDYEWVKDKLENWCAPITEADVRAELDDFEFEGHWYRPDDLFRKKVLGKFPLSDEDALIPAQWVEMAHRRWEEAEGKEMPSTALRILGVDVAGMGRDSSVFCERKGPWVAPFVCHNSGGNADHTKVAGYILARRGERKDLFVSIDTIGEGAGVYSMAVQDALHAPYIISCKFSEGARNPRSKKPLTDVSGQYEFLNMRAYLHWAVRDWLDPANETGAMLPPDEKLDEEISEVHWFFRSDGRIQIEPKDDIKERLGRSPDRLDALANTFYPIAPRKAIDLNRIADMIGY